VTHSKIDVRFICIDSWENGLLQRCSKVKTYKFHTLISKFLMDFDHFRRMLRLHKKANDCWWMGMGLVARHRRPEALTRSDDSQPDVRDGGNSTRRRTHRHRCRPSQNHEGDCPFNRLQMFFFSCISFFFRTFSLIMNFFRLPFS
jgi:hypothetical protein